MRASVFVFFQGNVNIVPLYRLAYVMYTVQVAICDHASFAAMRLHSMSDRLRPLPLINYCFMNIT